VQRIVAGSLVGGRGTDERRDMNILYIWYMVTYGFIVAHAHEPW
jgi:hypothetical protein